MFRPMMPTFVSRMLVLGVALVGPAAMAAEPTQIVFKNGRSVPLSALSLQGTNLVVTGEAEGYAAGQSFPFDSADHVYGERPEAVGQAIALLVSGKPAEAAKLLEPVLAAHQLTSKIPGNFWLEAAHAAIVANALDGKAPKADAIGKEISETRPGRGVDPFARLGKTLLLPATTKIEERLEALKDFTTDDQPAAVAAYATFFTAKAFRDAKRDPEALESFLTVTGVYPTGNIFLNAAAEVNAADILSGLTRREEALALLNSASRNAKGTVLADEAKRRLDSLK